MSLPTFWVALFLQLIFYKTLQLLPILSPANATTTYTWKSSKTSVAKVSKTGLVTPVKTGTAKITVKTANGKSASVKVKVVNPYAATAVAIATPNGKTVTAGDTLQLAANAYPTNAIYKLTWKSSKTSVAKVNSKGVVTGVKAGTAKITVTTDSGRTVSVTVTVVKASKRKELKSYLNTNAESTAAKLGLYFLRESYRDAADSINVFPDDTWYEKVYMISLYSNNTAHCLEGVYPGMSYSAATSTLNGKGYSVSITMNNGVIVYNYKKSGYTVSFTLSNQKVQAVHMSV